MLNGPCVTPLPTRLVAVILTGIAGFCSTGSVESSDVHASSDVHGSVRKSERIDYARDIRPILSTHCWNCHGPDEQSRQADLRLDTYEDATAELASGSRAIDPAELEASELLVRIASTDESEMMPPPSFKKPLSPAQVELLQKWVTQGAEFTGHWAFKTPLRPELPQVKDSHWPRQPLDFFVLRKLEELQQQPNPSAPRETLLRRVTFDLTGLPPSLQELQEFLADQSPEAYERVVDRLLVSPRHAERMALQWLDAARYADTNGYNNDEERTMWPWRDWVLNAFANNMPYDQFLVEQLAGDLLPNPSVAQRIATGFNRNHVLTTEGGIIEEEYRVEYVADRVHTTATVFFGLSFQCARCHDHKFDPISQRDYYRLYSFFNTISDKVVFYDQGGIAEPFLAAPTVEQQQQLAELDRRETSLKEQLAARANEVDQDLQTWEATLPATARQRVKLPAEAFFADFNDWSETTGPVHQYPSADAEPTAVTTVRHGEIRVTPGRYSNALTLDGNSAVECGDAFQFEKQDAVTISAWVHPTSNSTSAVVTKMDDAAGFRGFDILLEGGKPAVHIIHQWPDDGLKVVTSPPMKLNQWHHLAVTWDGSGKASGLVVYVDGKPQQPTVEKDTLQGTIVTSQPLRIGRRSTSCGFTGMIDDVRICRTVLPAAEVASLADPHSLASVSPILATPFEQRSGQQRNELRQYYLDKVDAVTQKLQAELTQSATERSALEKMVPKTMIMAEMDQPRQTHILNRGQYDQPGDPVDAGVAEFLAPMPADLPRNRLGLARWLVSPQHPLTARVAVNRWWASIFGSGLVETVEDFGIQGAYPSHPELLDYLATELIQNGWNVRLILKQIVLSATYQQSSAATPLQLEFDPQNRWLGRGARYRFPAETLRDGALAASGLLSERLGGPSVKPYQPEGLWEEVSVERRSKYVVDPGDGKYRRSIYTFWKRTCPPPGMTTFDAPDRETCLVRRARTNTPLQALVLLNDPTYLDASRHLAARIMDSGKKSTVEQLTLACQLTLSRHPQPREIELLSELATESRTRFAADPKSAEQLLTEIGTAGDSQKRDPVEWAVWTTVCSVLLNLDEALSQH